MGLIPSALKSIKRKVKKVQSFEKKGRYKVQMIELLFERFNLFL